MIGGIISGATELVGAAVGIGKGIKQRKEAKGMEAEVNRLNPDATDYVGKLMFEDIKRKQNAISTGSMSGMFSDQIQQGFASMADAVKTTASGSGADITGLLRANRNMGQMTNQAQATMQGQQIQYAEMANKLNERMFETKLEDQMFDYSTKLAQQQQLMESGQANIQAGIAQGVEGVGGMLTAGLGMKNSNNRQVASRGGAG